MEQSRRRPVMLLPLGVMALFLAGFLLLVIFGARSFRNIVDSQYDNMDDRALSAYIAASVKANDGEDAVSIEESEYGQVLVVADRDSGYAMRYYCWQGQLVEDFARAGAPLAPEDAQCIAPTSVFSAAYRAEGLLEITTDAGRALVYVRSGGEAEP